ncbi:hypothetical protein [uncultured Treponema sp.]|uniref:hypothetical protein n=1 Tax=uncultured Treponema sp. TaxID=162155 RepID=UPI002588A70B|nr:hypothetical protein [uncultured Treponema sp.]
MHNDFLESKTAKTIHWFISLIGIIVAIFASIPQIKEIFYKPCHELELIVPDIKVNNTTFVIENISNHRLMRKKISRINSCICFYYLKNQL